MDRWQGTPKQIDWAIKVQKRALGALLTVALIFLGAGFYLWGWQWRTGIRGLILIAMISPLALMLESMGRDMLSSIGAAPRPWVWTFDTRGWRWIFLGCIPLVFFAGLPIYIYLLTKNSMSQRPAESLLWATGWPSLNLVMNIATCALLGLVFAAWVFWLVLAKIRGRESLVLCYLGLWISVFILQLLGAVLTEVDYWGDHNLFAPACSKPLERDYTLFILTNLLKAMSVVDLADVVGIDLNICQLADDRFTKVVSYSVRTFIEVLIVFLFGIYWKVWWSSRRALRFGT
jgi:hypothetical protein